MLEGALASASLVPAGGNTYDFLSGRFSEELAQVVLGMCIIVTCCELFCIRSGLAQKKKKKSGLRRRGGWSYLFVFDYKILVRVFLRSWP